MSDTKIVILAAGKGKRLESLGFDLPKPLIPLLGKPMISYLLNAVRDAQVDSEPVIVTAPEFRAQFCDMLGGTVCRYVVQENQLGTGHAVMCAQGEFSGAEHIMVLYGDHPALKAETIKRLADEHRASGATLTVMTVKFPDFNGWRQWFYGFGRVVRNEQGEISRIVELKDATPEEEQITEVNPSYFVFNRSWLCENMNLLTNKNAQGEYYLTDMIQMAVDQNRKLHSLVVDDAIEAIGVNTPEQLKAAEEALGQV